MVRTQIYLDERQRRLLAERAARRGTTVSEVIRRAVDAELRRDEPEDDFVERWTRALDATFGVAPSLPPGDVYVAEVRAEERRRRGR